MADAGVVAGLLAGRRESAAAAAPSGPGRRCSMLAMTSFMMRSGFLVVAGLVVGLATAYLHVGSRPRLERTVAVVDDLGIIAQRGVQADEALVALALVRLRACTGCSARLRARAPLRRSDRACDTRSREIRPSSTDRTATSQPASPRLHASARALPATSSPSARPARPPSAWRSACRSCRRRCSAPCAAQRSRYSPSADDSDRRNRDCQIRIELTRIAPRFCRHQPTL